MIIKRSCDRQSDDWSFAGLNIFYFIFIFVLKRREGKSKMTKVSAMWNPRVFAKTEERFDFYFWKRNDYEIFYNAINFYSVCFLARKKIENKHKNRLKVSVNT